ncbi:MAG: hypothetical protein ABIH29_06110 [Candidatus Micrarchaeota archaeon]
MAKKLSEVLAGAEDYAAALQHLKGKTLAVDHGLPSPPKFKVLEVKGDYLIGQWQNKEFLTTFKMKVLLSLAD